MYYIKRVKPTEDTDRLVVSFKRKGIFTFAEVDGGIIFIGRQEGESEDTYTYPSGFKANKTYTFINAPEFSKAKKEKNAEAAIQLSVALAKRLEYGFHFEENNDAESEIVDNLIASEKKFLLLDIPIKDNESKDDLAQRIRNNIAQAYILEDNPATIRADTDTIIIGENTEQAIQLVELDNNDRVIASKVINNKLSFISSIHFDEFAAYFLKGLDFSIDAISPCSAIYKNLNGHDIPYYSENFTDYNIVGNLELFESIDPNKTAVITANGAIKEITLTDTPVDITFTHGFEGDSQLQQEEVDGQLPPFNVVDGRGKYKVTLTYEGEIPAFDRLFPIPVTLSGSINGANELWQTNKRVSNGRTTLDYISNFDIQTTEEISMVWYYAGF